MAEEEKVDSSKKTDDTDKLKRSLKIMRILTAFSAVLIVILVVMVLIQSNGSVTGSFVQLTEEEIGEMTVNFINENLVSEGGVTLVSVEELSGVYEVVVNYQDQDIPLHVSKDGVFLFQGSIDMTEVIESSEQPSQQPEEVPKSDKPEAHAFVMSHCPYGLQFIKAYIPVIELLGDEAEVELNFVHYIMHGKEEIDDNNRMYCVQKEQKDKLAAYLRCFVKEGDWEGCFDEVGIDKAKIESCISSTDEEFKITELYNDQSTWSGGSYPQYPVDAELANQYDVRGSPTFVVNGKTVSVNRSPEAIKQVICSAFNSPPSDCEQELSTTVEAPSWGPVEAGSGSDSSGTC
jgi:protein-disulfide isomerase